ncbi:GNAT family N-acetyltransferase [Bacillus sp. SG-1]|uniref:GNAT family N-acetyltransferase n=1 Tax=Bacillus sp. SG-1 TaxID=161544 RepID=UPI00015438E7|nr:GNAT family N-acetyltransferase [Bacillus sp. SG-1]EDL66726.1 hypothetical protein BSG1_05200 [Bacillus sp. SG-1]
MIIRKASISDASGIAKVQVDTWKTTYKGLVPDDYLDAMTYESREQKWDMILKEGTAYVAEDKGRIIGFSSGGMERTQKYPEFKGELYAIYILEEYQRKGWGKKLIKPVVNDLLQKQIDSMTVTVLEDNPSRLFYESLGAVRLDSVEVEMAGVKLPERVYGWKDIKKILFTSE